MNSVPGTVKRRIQERHRLSQKYGRQALELANEKLSVKLKIPRRAVVMIANGQTPPASMGIHHQDVRLCRSCVSERDRLKSLKGDHTSARMAVEYGLPRDQVEAIINEAMAPYSGALSQPSTA